MAVKKQKLAISPVNYIALACVIVLSVFLLIVVRPIGADVAKTVIPEGGSSKFIGPLVAGEGSFKDGTLSLKWQPTATDTIVGYQVYRATEADGPYVPQRTGRVWMSSQTSFTQAIAGNRTLYYKIKAIVRTTHQTGTTGAKQPFSYPFNHLQTKLAAGPLVVSKTTTQTSPVAQSPSPKASPVVTPSPVTGETDSGRHFLSISESAVLTTTNQPNWLVDQYGITDAVVSLNSNWTTNQLYTTAGNATEMTSRLQALRTKLGDRVNFWPVIWSFNSIGWTGKAETSPNFHLAGAWNDDARWQRYYTNLGYLSQALASSDATGLILDLENYGDTPGGNGGMMRGLAWKDSPLVSSRAHDWWAAVTTSWSGEPGFYIHWVDGKRWPALKKWARTIYDDADTGVFLFEDSFTATANNTDFAGVAGEIRSALGKQIAAYPGLWVSSETINRVKNDMKKALRLNDGYWLYDNVGSSVNLLNRLYP